MKALIIDRVNDDAERLKGALLQKDVEVVVESTKSGAAERIKKESFDLVLFDPVPQMDEARAFIMMLRRSTKPAPFVVLTGQNVSDADAKKTGANMALNKPRDDFKSLFAVVDAVARLSKVSVRLSANGALHSDGILPQEAFNQLFVACMDRADRYGENSYYIGVDVENYAALGADAAQVEANLRAEIVRIKRMSDLGGTLGNGSFGILLMRPMRDDEPLLAANRIAEFIMRDLVQIAGNSKPNINVELIEIPTGRQMVRHMLPN